MHYDVFNGDADGIIALLQLRLAAPKDSILITGVKRDIQLLAQVPAENASSVTVLDISMEKNITALEHLLSQSVDVFYVDHHRSGDIPDSVHLSAIINTDANTCTSLLINQYLDGKYANWAVTAAYGDNMFAAADLLADNLGLTEANKIQLKALGTYINYNGYGRSVDDLHYAPDSLYQQLLAFDDPLVLINAKDNANSIFTVLENAYLTDMANAQASTVLHECDVCQVIELEDAAWARRVSGVFGNDLANQSPDRAHAVLTQNENETYTVSLRAPLSNKQGADEVCVQFPTGGGRSAAAGINQLPAEMLGKFIETVSKYYR
jgi:hypothetical protein